MQVPRQKKTFVVILDLLHEQKFYLSGVPMQQIDCNSPVYFDLEMGLKVWCNVASSYTTYLFPPVFICDKHKAYILYQMHICTNILIQDHFTDND